MSLARFVEAQAGVWPTALRELQDGRKASHWMWFIFPQLAALGRSHRAKHYGIAELAEAQAYARHEVLGPRLREAAEAVLLHPDLPVEEIMGGIDALKLRSSATLFERADPDCNLYARVIETFYAGERCPLTLAEIGRA